MGKIYAEGFMVPTANPRTTTQPAVSQPTVRQMVPMKIKTCILLMEAGISSNKQRLHNAGYFRELLASNPDIDQSLRTLLGQCRDSVVRFATHKD